MELERRGKWRSDHSKGKWNSISARCFELSACYAQWLIVCETRLWKLSRRKWGHALLWNRISRRSIRELRGKKGRKERKEEGRGIWDARGIARSYATNCDAYASGNTTKETLERPAFPTVSELHIFSILYNFSLNKRSNTVTGTNYWN